MRTRSRWTPLMDEYLLKKRKEGESFAFIGSGLGLSGHAVANRFRRMFPDASVPGYIPRRRVHSPETRKAVITMRLSGVSHKQVARQMGLTMNQVTGIWNHWRDYEVPRRRAA